MSKSFNIDMKATVVESQVKELEREFVFKTNKAIAERVTPLYNIFLLASAACFGYLVYTQGDAECYAKGTQIMQDASEEGTSNVAKEFWLLANAGVVLYVLSALL